MAEDEKEIRMSEEEISALLKSFRPIREFDEEIGIFVPFMKMNCYFCNKGKVTSISDSGSTTFSANDSLVLLLTILPFPLDTFSIRD